MILFIPSCEPDNGQGGEEDVIGCVQLKVIDLGAGEEREPAIGPDRYNQQDVLVKHVRDCIRITAIVLSAMMKQQVFQETELSDRVV